MKFLLKIWDVFLFVFAYSTTSHCDKLKWDKAELTRSKEDEKRRNSSLF